ncbi:MAG: hypothetical protein ACK5O2_09500 [Microthrixaceae bacterium]
MRDLDGVEVVPEPLGGTSAAIGDRTAYVLQEAVSPASLGAAVVHALRSSASRLVLFADDGADVAARLAARFDRGPSIEVRAVDGATSSPAVPEGLSVVLPGPDGVEALLDRLRSAGLETVLEAGVWRGELLGLEVARIVLWPIETGGDGTFHIEAGVGRFDRDATAAMHGGESTDAALERVIGTVSAQRHRGATGHPMCRLARSRWLRAEALADPALVGAGDLYPVESSFVADSVREERPAAAHGTTADGEPVVVVFGSGLPLELVPVALDVREMHDPGVLLRVVVPPRDRLGVTEDLLVIADPTGGPVELVTLDPPWGTGDGDG